MECEVCRVCFPSRNQLFIHLKAVEGDRDHGIIDAAIRTSAVVTTVEVQRPFSLTIDNINSESSPMAIEIADEDSDWYRVIVKPQGLATMGTRGLTVMTSPLMMLPNAIALKLPYKKAYPCHRLDQETGGLMVCSKSKAAERAIMQCFNDKLVHKRYRAIVRGRLEPAMGIIDTKISEKDAITLYSSVLCTRSAQYGWITTVDLWPITGRKHQLRRHMQSIGHFIVGDRRHSHSLDWPSECTPMFLWALEVKFPHPNQHHHQQQYFSGNLEYNGVADNDTHSAGTIGPGSNSMHDYSIKAPVSSSSTATAAIGARRKERFTDPPIELLSRCLSTQTDGCTSISDASSLQAIASYYQHLSPVVCNRNMVVVEIDEPVSYDQYRRSESSSYS